MVFAQQTCMRAEEIRWEATPTERRGDLRGTWKGFTTFTPRSTNLRGLSMEENGPLPTQEWRRKCYRLCLQPQVPVKSSPRLQASAVTLSFQCDRSCCFQILGLLGTWLLGLSQCQVDLSFAENFSQSRHCEPNSHSLKDQCSTKPVFFD